MGYGILADAIVALHVAYVSYVVLGQLLIWLGIALKWSWIRNPWFRWTHVLCMTIVGVEAVLNIPCPLTTWEDTLREWAGQAKSGKSFIGRCLYSIIFFENVDEWVLTACHIGFAVLVLATLWLIPPRRRLRPAPQPK